MRSCRLPGLWQHFPLTYTGYWWCPSTLRAAQDITAGHLMQTSGCKMFRVCIKADSCSSAFSCQTQYFTTSKQSTCLSLTGLQKYYSSSKCFCVGYFLPISGGVFPNYKQKLSTREEPGLRYPGFTMPAAMQRCKYPEKVFSSFDAWTCEALGFLLEPYPSWHLQSVASYSY